MDITIEQIENAIDAYMEHTSKFDDVPTCYQDLLTFVADKLGVDQDELDTEYNDILTAYINNDEDAYIDAGDAHRQSKSEYKAELQDSFMKFYKERMINEDTDDELYQLLMDDPILNRLRKTPDYINADVPSKFNKIWSFAIREYGNKCADEDSLGDTCEKIATEDENSL